jgi:hypothetical protein
MAADDIDSSEWDVALIPERVRNRGSLVLSLNDALREYKPIPPGVYVRISFDRFGLEKGVTRQLKGRPSTAARPVPRTQPSHPDR